MLVRIQRNQIHHFKEEVVDADGNPTGEIRDILQLDISSVEHPHLPTYGIRVDITGMTTKAEVKTALTTEILSLIDRVKVQMQRDAAVRQYFDDWGWLEFDTDSL